MRGSRQTKLVQSGFVEQVVKPERENLSRDDTRLVQETSDRLCIGLPSEAKVAQDLNARVRDGRGTAAGLAKSVRAAAGRNHFSRSLVEFAVGRSAAARKLRPLSPPVASVSPKIWTWGLP
jgi:hypothetical protein